MRLSKKAKFIDRKRQSFMGVVVNYQKISFEEGGEIIELATELW